MAETYAFLLFILTVVTGVVSFGWVITRGIRFSGEQQGEAPWIIATCQSLFPVFLAVFLVRSFVVEPFRIPSESMLPTLHVGDFILVNKHSYGLRLPLSHHRLTAGDRPQRGDVIVFRYPRNTRLPYIKRIVGMPGDTISYQDKKLYINDREIPLQPVPGREKIPLKRQLLLEFLPEKQHQVMHDQARPAFQMPAIVVPEGEYFVLGDNRDYSQDSRYWGFVPESHIIGRAFFIWFHWKHGVKWSRMGSSII